MLGRAHSPPPQSSATDFQPGEPGGRLLVPRRADAAGDSPAPPSHLGPGSRCVLLCWSMLGSLEQKTNEGNEYEGIIPGFPKPWSLWMVEAGSTQPG